MPIESEVDWEGLRQAAKVARITLDALENEVRPGVTTAQLDLVAARLFAEHGARSAPTIVYGFPGTVLISINDEIFHGIPGSRRIRAGDVVKLDVTVEKDGYVADVARTVVVEPASKTAHRLSACAIEAFEAALAVASAGVLVNEIGRAVESVVHRRGFSVLDGLAGHGVGRTIHEEPSVPNRFDRMQRDVLTEGLVITIEPLIGAGSHRVVEDRDGWTLRTADGRIAAHHEHTVVIMLGEPVVLTAAAGGSR